MFLILQHGGKLTIERAYFRATAQSGGGTGEAKEKPAFGHEGHQRMTRIATTAVRNAVAVNPAVAYDTMVAHQGWMVLRNRSDHGYALSFAKAGAEPAEGITVKGIANTRTSMPLGMSVCLRPIWSSSPTSSP